MYRLVITIFILLPAFSFGQETTYEKELSAFRKNYIDGHGAVMGKDRKNLHFFTVDENYKVAARFERIYDAPWFGMPTSSNEKKAYRVYGILYFTLKDTVLKLHIYESEALMNSKKYADHLFIPFTDGTNGEETYENGRYIDVKKSELDSESFVLDFNKAYNPYCAYISNRYSCPLPPKENALSVSIHAGERKYGTAH